MGSGLDLGSGGGGAVPSSGFDLSSGGGEWLNLWLRAFNLLVRSGRP